MTKSWQSHATNDKIMKSHITDEKIMRSRITGNKIMKSHITDNKFTQSHMSDKYTMFKTSLDFYYTALITTSTAESTKISKKSQGVWLATRISQPEAGALNSVLAEHSTLYTQCTF